MFLTIWFRCMFAVRTLVHLQPGRRHRKMFHANMTGIKKLFECTLRSEKCCMKQAARRLLRIKKNTIHVAYCFHICTCGGSFGGW